jgi:hypothetical protein
MIEGSLNDAGVVRRLTAKARKLVQARVDARRLSDRGDPARWRRADLLWPLIGSED